jgi:hypothetical protein
MASLNLRRSVKASVYFRHPSGRQDKFIRSDYEVEKEEFARLIEALTAFHQGELKGNFYTLTLVTRHQVPLRLDEITDIYRDTKWDRLAGVEAESEAWSITRIPPTQTGYVSSVRNT